MWGADGGGAVRTLTGHQDYLSCAALSSSGKLLVSGGFDKTVRLWDPQTGAALAVLTAHTAHVETVAISPDARLVASAGADRSM